MASPLRRLRGSLLRLVRQPGLSVGVGLLLVVPSAWVQLSGRFEAWWINGLSLVAGATGLALVWTGITGVAPDWEE